MTELLQRMIRERLAHQIDGDVLVPLEGTARIPHAVLVVGGELTEVGRALEVAIGTDELPDARIVPVGLRETVEIRRRQVLGVLLVLGRAGIIRPLDAPAQRPEGAGTFAIPWQDESARGLPTEAEIAAFGAARDRARAGARS